MAEERWLGLHVKKSTVGAIVGTIVGAIMVGIITWITPALQSFWWMVWRGISNGFKWLFGTLPVYRWLFIVLLSFVAAVGVFIAYSRFMKKDQPTVPEYFQYTEDEFFGIVWRWNWRNNGLRDLTPYCIKCDRRLPCMGDSYFNDCQFYCLCGNRNNFSVTKNYLEGTVAREIERNIRHKSWRPRSSNE